MRKQRINRLLAGFMASIMLANQIPAFALAEETGLCEHHPIHSDCGYVQGVSGSACAHDHRKIAFRYTTHSVADIHKIIDKHDGKLYTVSPYQLVINDGNYYLIGLADDIEELRTYRIDRMRDVSILDERRNMRKEWSTRRDMKTYIRQTFSMFGGEQEKVTIRFENSLLDTVIDKFGVGFGAKYIPDGENHFTVTTEIAVSDQFYAWVCGFGRKVQIISPEKVAKDFKQYLSDIVNQY